MHLKTIPILTALGLSVGALFARELKEFDNDVNYDEARVPHYDLPDPLITAEGKPVTTAEQWRNVRRPQILSLFANFVYGAVPVPPDPIVQTYRVVREDKSFMGGKATSSTWPFGSKTAREPQRRLCWFFCQIMPRGQCRRS